MADRDAKINSIGSRLLLVVLRFAAHCPRPFRELQFTNAPEAFGLNKSRSCMPLVLAKLRLDQRTMAPAGRRPSNPVA